MTQLPALGIQSPDVVGAYGRGLQVKGMRDQAERERQLGGLRPDVLSGNEDALKKYAALDPKGANDLMELSGRLDERQREAMRQNVEDTARVVAAVEAAPEMARPEVYAQYRQQLIQQGVDPAQLPERYSPEMVPYYKAQVAAAKNLFEQDAPKTTGGMQYVDGQWVPIPGYAAQQERLRRAGAPQVNVSSGRQQTKEQEERGKYLVEDFKGVAERADSARAANMRLNIAREVATSTELPSQLQSFAGDIATSLGFDSLPEEVFGNITSGQAFNGVIGDLVLEKLAQQKGPQTDKDAARIERTVARLGNTPEARDFLIRSATALNERDIRKRDFYEDWYSERGTYDGASRAWNKRMEKTPLVGAVAEDLPIFYSEFERGMRDANPGISDEDIRKRWIANYGR